MAWMSNYVRLFYVDIIDYVGYVNLLVKGVPGQYIN